MKQTRTCDRVVPVDQQQMRMVNSCACEIAEPWRDGRVDYGGCLENNCGVKPHRGFESLSLRQYCGEVPEWTIGAAC